MKPNQTVMCVRRVGWSQIGLTFLFNALFRSLSWSSPRCWWWILWLRCSWTECCSSSWVKGLCGCPTELKRQWLKQPLHRNSYRTQGGRELSPASLTLMKEQWWTRQATLDSPQCSQSFHSVFFLLLLLLLSSSITCTPAFPSNLLLPNAERPRW